MSGRAIVTPSHSPSASACSMTVAVWNPPVHSTGMLDRLLDAMRIGQVHALDAREVAAGLLPAALEELARQAAVEEQVIAARSAARSRSACRRSCAVPRSAESLPGCAGAGKKLPLETWIASTPSASSNLQTCDRILERVALGLVVEQRVVVFDGADLHLQVEIACRPRVRIARTISMTKRARFFSAPP